MAKRRYSLDRMMARLVAESSQTVVGIVFLVMNLERWLLVPFLRLVKWFCSKLHSPTICIWAVARGAEDGSVLSVPVLQVTRRGLHHRRGQRCCRQYKHQKHLTRREHSGLRMPRTHNTVGLRQAPASSVCRYQDIQDILAVCSWRVEFC